MGLFRENQQEKQSKQSETPEKESNTWRIPFRATPDRCCEEKDESKRKKQSRDVLITDRNVHPVEQQAAADRPDEACYDNQVCVVGWASRRR